MNPFNLFLPIFGIGQRLMVVCLLVGVFTAQAARGEGYNAAGDVKAKSEATEPEAILAFTRRYAFKFFDVVLSAPVIGVVRKGRNGAGVVVDKIGVLFREL